MTPVFFTEIHQDFSKQGLLGQPGKVNVGLLACRLSGEEGPDLGPFVEEAAVFHEEAVPFYAACIIQS